MCNFEKSDMQAYRFETRISKKGIIKLPPNHELNGKEVEIIILHKEDTVLKKNAATEFVNKWAGFLSGVDEDAKDQYLTEKYELQNSLREVKLMQEGKIEKQSAEDFLNEL